MSTNQPCPNLRTRPKKCQGQVMLPRQSQGTIPRLYQPDASLGRQPARPQREAETLHINYVHWLVDIDDGLQLEE